MPGVIHFGFSAMGTMFPITGGDSSGIIGSEITDDWDEIREHSDNGTASSRYKIGQFKRLVLDGTVGGYTFVQYPCYCVIIGINHNADLEGNNRIHFCIGYSAGESINRFIALCHTNYSSLYSSSTGGFCMNTTNTDEGGWEASYMRNTICVEFISCLPVELQSVLKTVTKYTDNGNYNVNNITGTVDTIFLTSTVETGCSGTYTSQYEFNYQHTYEYFYTRGIRIYNNLALDSSDSIQAWHRSPFRNFDRYANRCFTSTNGYTYGETYNYANASLGFIPCFCV